MWHKIWWSFVRHRNIFSKWCPNIDKKIIEPIGNIITISYNSIIALKFCAQWIMFSFVYDILIAKIFKH